MKEEHTLDQNKAPIYEALQTFRQMRVVPFDVPGHKRGRGNPELTRFLGEQCVSIDVNSMKPLDNLCHPISVIREAEELAAAKQRMTELEDQLFSLRAQALTDRGDLLLLEPPTRPDGARKLADAAAKASGGLAAVFAGAESSYVYALVQADGADISPLVKRLNAALSGRGGGRNGFAQGSVQADRTAICDFFRKEGIECPTC